MGSKVAGYARYLILIISFSLVCAIDGSTQEEPSPKQSDSAAQPASVVIVVDISNNAGNSEKVLRKAARSFVKKLNSDDEIAIFATQDKPILLQSFTSDTSLLQKSLANLRPAGKRLLYETVAQALEYIHNDAVNEKQGIVAYVHDLDPADPETLRALEDKIRQLLAVPIYFIALGHSSWQSQEWAQRLALLSGGAAYFPVNESDVTEVSQGIANKLGASAGANTTEGIAQSLRDYKTILVRKIPVADNQQTTQFPAGDNLLLEHLLVSRLEKANLFGNVVDAPDPNLDRGFSPGPNSNLELLASVVKYNRGHPGTPFGPSRMKVQVVLRDLATRQAIAAFTREKAGPSGMLRGSQEKVEAQIIIGIVDKIVSAIKEMKQPLSR